MDEYVFKVWSADRRIKKTFISSPSIELVIEKARLYGIQGYKLVLESDGSEICSDSVLEHYLKSKEIFMLLENEEWTEKTALNSTIFQKYDNTVNVIAETNEERVSNFPSPCTAENTIQNLNSQHPPQQENATNSQCDMMTIHSESVDLNSETTLTVLNGAPTPISECSKKVFDHFQIPWKKLPSDILEMLENKKKLGKKLNAFANLLVDEMRMISFYLPMSTLRVVSVQAATKFPESFMEKDNEGNIISTSNIPKEGDLLCYEALVLIGSQKTFARMTQKLLLR
ncbi:PREDICTED: uncharacterized protein LOC108363112 [Rhagoletis zephyria]|uniref:uncharacterized protein LOC108363112 n=1 Tax=Rhagoletis zephyria TaxID=28612 RepID=UPI000811598E|nr:PREDICTED: uncharacterized protein LOC108363112 [Rhagoletis zephyria]